MSALNNYQINSIKIVIREYSTKLPVYGRPLLAYAFLVQHFAGVFPLLSFSRPTSISRFFF